MPIEHDPTSTPLPPLKKITPPVVSIDALAAIGSVTLRAGDVPPRILRNFYEHTLGMRFVEADIDTLRFVYERREAILRRNSTAIGTLALLVKNFGEQTLRLRDHAIPYELIHSDAGMCLTAYLRDPAGNIIQLVETRAL